MTTYEEVPPRADAMIASMRAIGYDLSMAIADLIDNSISADAKNVWVEYHWEGPDSWIRILDDGHGMTEDSLKEAMRLGSQSPDEERRPEDLGRFGLGLKTASFSQCKVLTVRTKTPEGVLSTRFWDLDHVRRSKQWQLGTDAPVGTSDVLERIDDVPHGTLVVWQDLDRVVEEREEEDEARDIFYDKFLSVQTYLEMVFHRYLSPPTSLSITVGAVKLRPWDPYLRSNPFTQELASERYEDGTIRLVPYVLPHVSKRNAVENEAGAGPMGWNAQQGFYLYRNRRMIVPGGYLDFDLKPEEHYKLARIMVDIDNRMDHEWRIDVRKATAIPPDRIRAELAKVARATRAEAVRVYRARTGVSRSRRTKSRQEVWLKRRRGDKITYEINRDNPVIRTLLDQVALPKSWVKRLFHIIETTVPHRLIIMDNAELEDCHVDLPPEIHKPGKEFIELCREFYETYRERGKSHNEAVDVVLSIEPFNTHPAYRATLDALAVEDGDA